MFKGYLVGSLHMHMSPGEFDILQKKLMPLVTSVDRIFLECPLPHFSTLTFGVERAILANVDELGNDDQLRYFESMAFQLAMLNSNLWFGKRIVAMPWYKHDTLMKNPRFWLSVTRIAGFFARLYNFSYNLFTGNKHTLAVQAHAKLQHELLLKITNAYARGESYELPKADGDMVMLAPRNAAIAKTMKTNLEADTKTSLYAVGAAHFPGETGLVATLQKNGFDLEPVNFA
jgi:hypothetical protein